MENTPVVQTSSTEPTPILSPPNNKYSKLIIGSILILGVFVSGGLSLGKIIYSPQSLTSKNIVSPTNYPTNTPTQSLIPSLTPDPTANWKTIKVETEPTLELADYQIMLPVGWWRIEHSSAFQSTETFRDVQNAEGIFTYQLTIHETKNINEKTNKPFTTLQSLTGFPYELPTRIIDAQQAIQVLPRAGSEMDYKVLFFSKDNNLIIDIELDTPRDGSKASEGKVLFDQILSTFKFSDTNRFTSNIPITKIQCPPCSARLGIPCFGPRDFVTADAVINSIDELSHPERVAGPDINLTIQSFTKYQRAECATYRVVQQGDNIKIAVYDLSGYVYPANPIKIYEYLKPLIGKTVNIYMTCTETCRDGVIQKIY